MANVRELLAAGFGQPVDTPLRVSGRPLSWAERRRVLRLVHRGEAAWDERSARYGVEVAHSIERAPSFFSPRGTTVFMAVLTLAAAALAVGKWSDDGLSVGAVFYTVFSVVWAIFAIRAPVWLRNAPRARAANEALLSSTATRTEPAAPGAGAEAGRADGTWTLPDPSARPPRSRREERLGLALAIGLAALLFGGSIFSSDDHDAVGAVIGGLFFGVFFVPVMRLVGRRAHGQQARGRSDAHRLGDGSGDDHIGADRAVGPPTPIAVELWEELPPRLRQGLRTVGAAFAALFLWIMVMAQTQLSTCDTTEGGLNSADQTGFTRSFCGTPGADAAGTVLTYALVAVLPVIGLLLAAFAAGWRSGATRWRLLGAAAVLVAVPVGVAWLLAGAH